MSGSIKLFRSVRISYKTMGIYSSDSNQIFILNSKKLFFLLSLIISFISHLAYFIFEAKFIEDNGFKSFYESFSGGIALSVFLLNIWQMPVILQSIRMYDEFIAKRKSLNRSLLIYFGEL